jgi:hypothetical protein
VAGTAKPGLSHADDRDAKRRVCVTSGSSRRLAVMMPGLRDHGPGSSGRAGLMRAYDPLRMIHERRPGWVGREFILICHRC